MHFFLLTVRAVLHFFLSPLRSFFFYWDDKNKKRKKKCSSNFSWPLTFAAICHQVAALPVRLFCVAQLPVRGAPRNNIQHLPFLFWYFIFCSLPSIDPPPPSHSILLFFISGIFYNWSVFVAMCIVTCATGRLFHRDTFASKRGRSCGLPN